MLNQFGAKLGFLEREVKGKDRAESHGVEGKPCFQVIVFLEGLQESSMQEANGWKNERLWESLVQETQEANNQKMLPEISRPPGEWTPSPGGSSLLTICRSLGAEFHKRA